MQKPESDKNLSFQHRKIISTADSRAVTLRVASDLDSVGVFLTQRFVLLGEESLAL